MTVHNGNEKCKWFARCENGAIGTLKHPALGDVPVCERCAKFLYSLQDVTPFTKGDA